MKELTGDWVNYIPCDAIQAKERWFYDEVVYFGAGADLDVDGKAEVVNRVSMADRYNYDE